jgi:hypothetical protein
MSSVSPQDHLNPQDPTYYAPPWLRDRAMLPSIPAPKADAKTDAERPKPSTASPPRYDALLEEAVSESLRHRLDPEVMLEPPFEYEGRALFGVAGRFAAAIGGAAIVALFFVVMVPTAQGHAPNSTMTSLSGLLSSIKTALAPAPKKEVPEIPLSEYHLLASAGAAQPQPQPAASEDSEALLQKFMQWQQKPDSTGSISRDNR